jgi:hypothetical protein
MTRPLIIENKSMKRCSRGTVFNERIYDDEKGIRRTCYQQDFIQDGLDMYGVRVFKDHHNFYHTAVLKLRTNNLAL